MLVEARVKFEVGCGLLILDVGIINGRPLMFFLFKTTHEDCVRFLYHVEEQAWPSPQME